MKLVLALALISLATATAAYSDGPRSSRAEAEGRQKPPLARALLPPGSILRRGRVKLVGRLSGTGDVAVILAHGYSQSIAQDDWQPFVPALVGRGYTVLTFNFRGFCDSKDACSEAHRQGWSSERSGGMRWPRLIHEDARREEDLPHRSKHGWDRRLACGTHPWSGSFGCGVALDSAVSREVLRGG